MLYPKIRSGCNRPAGALVSLTLFSSMTLYRTLTEARPLRYILKSLWLKGSVPQFSLIKNRQGLGIVGNNGNLTRGQVDDTRHDEPNVDWGVGIEDGNTLQMR